MMYIIIFLLFWPTTKFYYQRKGRYFRFFGQGLIWAWLDKDDDTVIKIEWDQEVKDEDGASKGKTE